MLERLRPSQAAWNVSVYPARLLMVAFIGAYLWVLGTAPAVIPLAVVVAGAVLYCSAYLGIWWRYRTAELPPPLRYTATALDSALLLLVVPLDPLAGLPLLILVVINPFEFSVRYHAKHLLGGYVLAALTVAGILLLRSLAGPGLSTAVIGVLLVLAFIVPYGLLTAFGTAVVAATQQQRDAVFENALKANRNLALQVDPMAETGAFFGDMNDMVGLPPDTALYSPFAAMREYLHPEDMPQVAEALREAARPGGSLDMQFRHQHVGSGTWRWANIRASAETNDAGQYTNLIGVIRDITDQVQADQELTKAREFLEAAVTASGIGVWAYDVEQDHVEFDDSEIKLIQPQPGEFDGTAASFVGLVEPDERDEVARVFAAIAADGQQRSVRLRRRLPDGRVRTMMGGGRGVEFKDGKPLRLVGATVDVTDLVEAQRAEEQFRERHDKALNSAQISCWYWDATTNTMEFDDWAHEQMGVKRDELLPTVEGFAALVYEPDRPIVQKHIEDSIAHLESFDVTFRVKNRLPKVHWRRTYGRVFREAAGVCIGFSGIVMDVTPEMELRAELEDTTRTLDRSLNRSSSVAWTLDMAGGTGSFYGDVRSLIGLPPGPPLNAFQAIAGQVHPDDQVRVRDHLVAAAKPGGEVDIRFRVPHGQTGEPLWMHAQGSAATDAHGEFDGITGIMRDITAEEATQHRLRVLTERFRAAAEAGGIGTWSYDVAGGDVDMDARLAELLDVPPGEFDGRIESFMGLVHPDDQAATGAALSELVEQSIPQGVRFRRPRRDGSTAWIQVHATATRSDAAGRAERIAGASFDVTELVDALAVERRYYERHTVALEAALSACWFWDAATDTMEFDPMGERLLGCEPGGLEPTMGGFAARVHPDDQERMAKAVENIIAEQNDLSEEYRAIQLDGSVRWLRSHGRAFRDDDGNCLALGGVIMDISVEMKLRQALEHSNAELDDFAHIASHDLREPLRGLHNYAEFLQEDYADKLDDEGRHMLTSLGRLAQRLESLIGALQQYARLGRAEQAIAATDLNTVLDEVLDTMAYSLDDAGVAVVRAEALPTWECEAARIGEVLRNLINNGVKYNDEEAKQVTVGFDAAQQAVYVRDNGIGIAPEHKDRVFTMFKRLHTRDQYGGGTGSGLTLTQRIIERHGGRIWFESEPGAGTTFYFTIGHQEQGQGNE